MMHEARRIALWAAACAVVSAQAMAAPQAAAQAPASGGTPAAVAESHSPTPGTAPPAFGATLKQLPRDVWRFVSADTAVVLGIGLGAAGAGHLRDDEVLEDLQENVRVEDFVRPGNAYGAFVVQAGGALAVYLGARASGHPRLATTAIDVFRANVVSQAWVQATKVAVRRDRPDGTRFSFPSGHAASAFATASVLQRAYGWKIGAPAHGIAAYVAAARIAHNHHYLSDVLFGAAMGVAGGRTVTIGRGARRVQVGPAVVRGGLGVTGVVVGAP